MGHQDVTENSYCPLTQKSCNFGVVNEETFKITGTDDTVTQKVICINAIDAEEPTKFKCALWNQ